MQSGAGNYSTVMAHAHALSSSSSSTSEKALAEAYPLPGGASSRLLPFSSHTSGSLCSIGIQFTSGQSIWLYSATYLHLSGCLLTLLQPQIVCFGGVLWIQLVSGTQFKKQFELAGISDLLSQANIPSSHVLVGTDQTSNLVCSSSCS